MVATFHTFVSQAPVQISIPCLAASFVSSNIGAVARDTSICLRESMLPGFLAQRYDVWSTSEEPKHHRRILRAPKARLPQNDESYNPPNEYLFSRKQKDNFWNLPSYQRSVLTSLSLSHSIAYHVCSIICQAQPYHPTQTRRNEKSSILRQVYARTI